jgi:HEAT repeat protein
MKPIRTALLAIAAFALLAVAAFVFQSKQTEEGPRYQGRTFGEWAKDLQDLSPEIHGKAAVALGHFGTKAVPLLRDALIDENYKAKHSIVQGLTEVGQAGIDSLQEGLKDANRSIRLSSAHALGRIGSPDKKTVDALKASAQDGEPAVRAFAVDALGTLGAIDSIPTLIVALADDDPKVRSIAVNALGRLRSNASPAVPRLIMALRDSEAFVRRMAAVALGEIKDKRALPELRLLEKNDPDKEVRDSALLARLVIESTSNGQPRRKQH